MSLTNAFWLRADERVSHNGSQDNVHYDKNQTTTVLYNSNSVKGYSKAQAPTSSYRRCRYLLRVHGPKVVTGLLTAPDVVVVDHHRHHLIEAQMQDLRALEGWLNVQD
jgi:hypothetical protein